MFSMDYNFDVCFVLDVSGSMAPIMPKVKEQIKMAPCRLVDDLACAGRKVGQLRVALVTFTDFATDGDGAIRATRFFSVPDEEAEFFRAVDAVRIGKGGDRHNGLEALYRAILMDWTPLGAQRGRHIIVEVTNRAALPLGARGAAYPANIASLENVWMEGSDDSRIRLNPRFKRLMLYAPSCKEWDDVRGWDYSLSYELEENGDWIEIGMDDIIAEMVRS